MEDQRQYCLKWNNHPTNISLVFDRLRLEELFVDVTLATQDRQVSDRTQIFFLFNIDNYFFLSDNSSTSSPAVSWVGLPGEGVGHDC